MNQIMDEYELTGIRRIVNEKQTHCDAPVHKSVTCNTQRYTNDWLEGEGRALSPTAPEAIQSFNLSKLYLLVLWL